MHPAVGPFYESTEGVVKVEDGIWQLAVDRVLIKLVDSETAVSILSPWLVLREAAMRMRC